MTDSCRSSAFGALLVLIGLATPADARPQGAADAVPEHRIRLELSAVGSSPLTGKLKQGYEATATGIEWAKDLHFEQPGLGVGARLDVGVFAWASVGAVYWGTAWRGPSRHVHYRGVQVRDAYFPGGVRVRTQIDLQYAELSLRFVPLRLPRFRLWLGIGPAWFRLRLRVEGAGERGRAVIDRAIGPSLTYEFSARIKPWLTFYFGNGIAVAPYASRQAVLTSLRAGLRLRVLGPLEVTFGFTTRNGIVTSWNEQVRRDELTAGHRWRRARWNSAALEVGLAISL